MSSTTTAGRRRRHVVRDQIGAHGADIGRAAETLQHYAEMGNKREVRRCLEVIGRRLEDIYICLQHNGKL